jgi:hypothetical protein
MSTRRSDQKQTDYPCKSDSKIVWSVHKMTFLVVIQLRPSLLGYFTREEWPGGSDWGAVDRRGSMRLCETVRHYHTHKSFSVPNSRRYLYCRVMQARGARHITHSMMLNRVFYIEKDRRRRASPKLRDESKEDIRSDMMRYKSRSSSKTANPNMRR